MGAQTTGGLFAICVVITLLILFYNAVGIPFVESGGALSELSKPARRRGPTGDQTRGLVTDTVTNLILFVFGALYVKGNQYDAMAAAMLIPALSVMSEVSNFILDTGFRTDTLGVMLDPANAPPPACPKAYARAKNVDDKELRRFHLTIANLGTDVGFRSFVIMMVNFMISTQFEAAGRRRLQESGRDKTASALLPLVLWWLVTLVCSSLMNIVRFGWAYRATKETEAGKAGGSVSSEAILMFVMLVTLTYLGNADVMATGIARVVLAFAVLAVATVGMSLGVFNVPSCADYREPPTIRVVMQTVAFVLILLFVLASSVSMLRSDKPKQGDRRVDGNLERVLDAV